MFKYLNIALLLFLVAGSADAAVLSFKPFESAGLGVGEEFKLELLLDTEGEKVNAIQAVVAYPADLLDLVDISIGGSIVPLWIEEPTQNNGIVTLSGIMPSGFEGVIQPLSGKAAPGRIVSLIFSPRRPGSGGVVVRSAVVALHDGFGTETPITLIPASFETLNFINKKKLVEVDHLPPEAFTVRLVADPEIFDGKYFIVFSTQDKQSGIDHYEVSEGDAKLVEASSPYLLKDQSLRGIIKVVAVDRAGNQRVSSLTPDSALAGLQKKSTVPAWFWLALLVIIGVTACIWRITHRKIY